MMKRSFGTKMTFIAAAAVSLSLWPAACASNAATRVAATSSTVAASPAAVTPAPNLSFLPHPAFAYADSAGSHASIADIAEKAAPSVVNVASSRTIKRVRESQPLFDDPFFRHFFGPGMQGG